MGATGKGLLAAAGMAKHDESKEGDEGHDDQEGEVHPGKEAAMKEFAECHAAGDHAGMSAALDRHQAISK